LGTTSFKPCASRRSAFTAFAVAALAASLAARLLPAFKKLLRLSPNFDFDVMVIRRCLADTLQHRRQYVAVALHTPKAVKGVATQRLSKDSAAGGQAVVIFNGQYFRKRHGFQMAAGCMRAVFRRRPASECLQ
jgi:hypothetical protein